MCAAETNKLSLENQRYDSTVFPKPVSVLSLIINEALYVLCCGMP